MSDLDRMPGWLERLVTGWVHGGFLAGLLLLLFPLLTRGEPVWFRATSLLLPIYMLHQYEEHDDDRFRRFVNQMLCKGKEVLTPLAVFVIDVPGVWGVTAASLLLAQFWWPGMAPVAVYLVLVNGLIHAAQAAVFRIYNPGLGTAILLFLPVGGYALWLVEVAGKADWMDHIVGLGVAVGIHVAIVEYAFGRLKRLG